MDEEFISYEQALALKELGFDEPCLAFWDGKNPDAFYFNNIRDASGDYVPFQKHDRLKWFGAPLYQQAFRWFREKHKLWVYNIPYSGGKYCIEIWRLVEGDDYAKTREDRVIMDSWEEAEKACLDKLIEILKNKEND